MDNIKLILSSAVLLVVMSCFTCQKEIDQKWIGVYEAYNIETATLKQFSFVPGKPFVLTEFVAGEKPSYKSDTVRAADFKKDYILFKFPDYKLKAMPSQTGKLFLLYDDPVTLKKTELTETKEMLSGKWQLTTLDGKNLILPKPVTLNISRESNRINAYLGCNRGGGDLVISGQFGQVKRMISTKMACPDMSVEHKMIRTLRRFVIEKLTEDKLVINGANHMEFIKQ